MVFMRCIFPFVVRVKPCAFENLAEFTDATLRITVIFTSVIIIDFSFSVRNPGGQCPLVDQRNLSGKFFVDCLLHIALDAGCEMLDDFDLEAAIEQASDCPHNAIVGGNPDHGDGVDHMMRSEEHTSELQSLMRSAYA